ncbi:MAG: NERD domain-containing protein [Actinomycetia bacterium]|nr:NERD domain-containing protein [Actinomycetes bacterium]
MPGRNRQASVKPQAICVDTRLVIEGGVPGGSARHHAGQRRATADRLTLEANWLETIAADQGKMREILVGLPLAYTVLHDLNVPGSKGTIDHVVIGPGGAFIVVSRRYGEHIDYRDGQLWAGDRSMRSVLDGARVESELMTQTLSTPVVPVLALLDTLLPAATPGVVDGVLVTSDEYVVRVITRGAHTLLSPDKIHEITQRALPLLHTSGTVQRAEGSAGVLVPTGPDHGRRLPTPQPLSPESGRTLAPPVADDVVLSPVRRRVRSGRRRSGWGVGVAIAGLCLLAIAVGSLVRLVFTDDKAGSGTSPTVPVESSTVDSAGSSTVGSSTVPETAAPTTVPPPTNALPAPVVAYTAVCPAPGAGWELLPTWPGDIEGLAEYDVEMLITDSWVSLTGWKNATEETSATLHGQPANATYTIRMTAVLTDGSRSVNTPTPVTAPAESC